MLHWGFGRSAVPLLGFTLSVPLGRSVSTSMFGFICSEGSDFRAAGAVWLLLLTPSSVSACHKMPTTEQDTICILC